MRRGNDRCYGKGLCVIIRNFTADDVLRGYTADKAMISSFFEGTLNYEVLYGQNSIVELENLSHAELDRSLNKIHDILASGSYDRFFLFILSHGNAKGILTNEPGSKVNMEMGREYTVDQVVAKFNHVNLPNMRGYPKCIFVQACRGRDIPQVAADEEVNSIQETAQQRQARTPTVAQRDLQETELTRMANGGDILVCYPSEAGHFSFLTAQGSFLILEVIQAIKKYHREEHLMDILVEATFAVGQTIYNKEFRSGPNQEVETHEVSQMPHIVSTMTKKFYLYINQTDRCEKREHFKNFSTTLFSTGYMSNRYTVHVNNCRL